MTSVTVNFGISIVCIKDIVEVSVCAGGVTVWVRVSVFEDSTTVFAGRVELIV